MREGCAALAGALALTCMGFAAAQQTAPADARSSAPIDLEGHWVGLVTEDWRWRMVSAPSGDHASVPLNAEGIRVAGLWEPESDVDSCLPFGAPGLMRMPLSVRMAWLDEHTLEVRTDNGMQVRKFSFAPVDAPAEPTRQGRSVARFDGSALEVVTDNLLPGWLRRNGVPYSSSARVTEYYNTHSAYGQEGFTVTTIVHDPVYLTTDFVTSTTFLKLADDAQWRPTPCREPVQD